MAGANVSAFVITCDQDPVILGAVLRSVRFADEVILVDKGRGAPASFTSELVDGTFRVDWTPTVEETRPIAVSRCSHDWVVCLDDDEILSPACGETFHDFIRSERAEVLGVPIRHHVLGRHDERAYYWPEWRPTLFRRGAVEYGDTVHGGTRIMRPFMRLMEGAPAFITHLSHANVETWLEKTNRYTSQSNRSGVEPPPTGQFISWALSRLERYARHPISDDYVAATSILRGLYDVVDGLKRWEESQPDGHEEFRRLCGS